MENEFWLTMNDNIDIYVKKWYKENKRPRAIVQLAHGMAEHINRYDDFAEYLLERNIFVYGNDHRGHGKTGERQGLLGYFSDENGFTKTTNDLTVITDLIKQNYPDTPVFLIGHSMGSFLAREYIQQHSNKIDGVVLMGTSYRVIATSALARTIANALPAKEESQLMNNLAFNKYNAKIPHHKTTFDWLSRDEQVVEKYINDPFCGYVPTAGFFRDLMGGLIQIHLKEPNKSIRKDLPIFIVSGDADPVGAYGKGIFKVANHYNKIGIKSIKTMLFKNARHELLNEMNHQEIYSVIYRWINERL